MTKLHVSSPSVGVTTLRIDAPPANALGQPVRDLLSSELERIESDTSIRCVILTGTDRRFCAGDDLREAQSRGKGAAESLSNFGQLMSQIERLRVPVIAAINGPAIGGGLELALCCDIRIATRSAWFLGAGVNMGLMASTYRLPRLIGIGPAKAMLLTGTKCSADQAFQYGLVTALHDEHDLLIEAERLAARIASRAPLSVEASKQVIDKAFDLTRDGADQLTEQTLHRLAATEDHKTALEAFLAKQTPTFKRR